MNMKSNCGFSFFFGSLIFIANLYRNAQISCNSHAMCHMFVLDKRSHDRLLTCLGQLHSTTRRYATLGRGRH